VVVLRFDNVLHANAWPKCEVLTVAVPQQETAMGNEKGWRERQPFFDASV
jgi:hypothetical protein